MKHAHRGLDGTYRSAAEMERHRAALADAAIEEQLEVQTAFREQGARLQGVYDKKQRSEYEMAKRCEGRRGGNGWGGVFVLCRETDSLKLAGMMVEVL